MSKNININFRTYTDHADTHTTTLVSSMHTDGVTWIEPSVAHYCDCRRRWQGGHEVIGLGKGLDKEWNVYCGLWRLGGCRRLSLMYGDILGLLLCATECSLQRNLVLGAKCDPFLGFLIGLRKSKQKPIIEGQANLCLAPLPRYCSMSSSCRLIINIRLLFFFQLFSY